MFSPGQEFGRRLDEVWVFSEDCPRIERPPGLAQFALEEEEEELPEGRGGQIVETGGIVGGVDEGHEAGQRGGREYVVVARPIAGYR